MGLGIEDVHTSNADSDSLDPSVYVGFEDDILGLYLNGNREDTLIDGFTPGETYLAVVTLTLAGGNDTVAVDIYDEDDTFGNPTASATNSAFDFGSSLEFLGVAKGDNNTGAGQRTQFDEFRLGTELSDVVELPAATATAPEPSTAILALLSMAGVIGCARRRRMIRG